MARIPDEVIERLKKEVDLVELVRGAGVELRKAGADLVGCCPFHDDSTPSLVISPRKGLWHCLGACQTGGSVIDWVMRTDRVSFRHAVELLREGAATGEIKTAATRSTVRRLPPPVESDASDAEVLAQVVDYYQARLSASPDALAYLQRRRIDDPEAIERFRLGFADRTLGLRLPTKDSTTGRELRGHLERIGVYRTSGHEHLAGSLVVPIISPDGLVQGLYGRKVSRHQTPGTPMHLYLPGPHKGVWNEEALMSSSEVVLTESLIDALTFFCCGICNVTASYGTAGFTPDHRQAFSRHRVTRVLLAYDHDAPGDQAAAALATELLAAGIECFRVALPEGADVNDVARHSDDPRRALAALVRQARWMGAGEGPAIPSSAATAAPVVSPTPPAPAVTPVVASHDELVMEMGSRRWRVRGIGATPTPGSLKVNVRVGAGERFHLDVVDLYSARSRASFLAAARDELGTGEEELKRELGQVLLATEEARAGAEATARQATAVPEMSALEREEALALLADPLLVQRVGEAFSALGVVGEADAAIVSWLVATSRLAERPLAAMIQSSSAAGKSTLAEAALSLVPAEEKVSYSAMTGQALYYLGETDLAHKVLAVAEEEGAARASYALKLLVSEGHLSIAAAGKDPATGRLVTNTYEVRGPVALLMTTTAAEPELASRLLVLSVDEGRAQTKAVQSAQRDGETLEGLRARTRREELLALHHNAQRLLTPLAVVNPHAPGLCFPDRATRHRRDNAKFLGLIRAVALAHQHQRERKTLVVGNRTITYIEADTSDVALAQSLSEKVITPAADELAPATRRLLEAIGAQVATAGRRSFTRRELRQETGLSDTQLKVHLARLVDLEWLESRHAGPATSYRIVADYEPDRPDEHTDRPEQATDRPGIGRIANAEVRAIGRVSDGSNTATFSQVDDDEPADRPVFPRLHVLGEGATNGVVVEDGRR